MSDCKHCGKNIVLYRFSLGPKWMHQDRGAAFQDGMHEFCHLTRAEPVRPQVGQPQVGQPRETR